MHEILQTSDSKRNKCGRERNCHNRAREVMEVWGLMEREIGENNRESNKIREPSLSECRDAYKLKVMLKKFEVCRMSGF